jgi:cobalt-precorrin 5A hydrolase/precorrin-3B C17-methyltransferase
VIALYNPRSARRPARLAEAARLVLAHRPPETPVVIARNLGRAGETQRILRLDELADAAADMLSLILIGSRHTRLVAGDTPRLYTPRGYFLGEPPTLVTPPQSPVAAGRGEGQGGGG